MMTSSIDDLTDAILEAGFEDNADFFMNTFVECSTELFETGSVAVEVGKRIFVLSLTIDERKVYG